MSSCSRSSGSSWRSSSGGAFGGLASGGASGGGSLDAAGGDLNVGAFLVVGIAELGISFAYFAYSWVVLRGTPGMRMLGLQIGDQADGHAISWDQALVRWLLLGIAATLTTFAVYVPDLVGLGLAVLALAWLSIAARTPRRRVPRSRASTTGPRRTILVKGSRAARLSGLISTGYPHAARRSWTVAPGVTTNVVDNAVDPAVGRRHSLSCPEGPHVDQDRGDHINADRGSRGRSGRFVMSGRSSLAGGAAMRESAMPFSRPSRRARGRRPPLDRPAAAPRSRARLRAGQAWPTRSRP